jgi:thiamine kinase-like enzyme
MNSALSKSAEFFLSELFGSSYQCALIAEGANAFGYKINNYHQEFFLKVYKGDDNNQRYQRETFFYTTFGKVIGTHATLLASSNEARCLLLTFVNGARLNSASEDYVKSAVKFFEKINTQDVNSKMPLAAEPAFTIIDFHTIVQRRIESGIFRGSNVSACVKLVSKALSDIKLDQYDLPVKNIYSPSDFGAHNTLLNGNEYYFIDFEYAGVDSYWKFLCDFFAQPDFPIPLKMLQIFQRSSTWSQENLDIYALSIAYRMTLLKWVMLILATGVRLKRDPGIYIERAEQYFMEIDFKVEAFYSRLDEIKP